MKRSFDKFLFRLEKSLTRSSLVSFKINFKLAWPNYVTLGPLDSFTKGISLIVLQDQTTKTKPFFFTNNFMRLLIEYNTSIT